jgi:hypothetical protein
VFADGWVALVRATPYRIDWCAPGARHIFYAASGVNNLADWR